MGEEQGLSAELKPCPFCGGELTVTKHFRDPLWRGIHRCEIVGAITFEWSGDPDKIAAAWNTRAEGLQPPVGEGEEEVFSSLGASKAPARVSAGVAETPSEVGCRCYNCLKLSGERSPFWPENLGAAPLACDTLFIVCAICGNKRCPHATDHRWACTRSNAAGQHGSSYGDFAPPTDCQTSGGEA